MVNYIICRQIHWTYNFYCSSWSRILRPYIIGYSNIFLYKIIIAYNFSSWTTTAKNPKYILLNFNILNFYRHFLVNSWSINLFRLYFYTDKKIIKIYNDDRMTGLRKYNFLYSSSDLIGHNLNCYLSYMIKSMFKINNVLIKKYVWNYVRTEHLTVIVGVYYYFSTIWRYTFTLCKHLAYQF